VKQNPTPNLIFSVETDIKLWKKGKLTGQIEFDRAKTYHLKTMPWIKYRTDFTYSKLEILRPRDQLPY